MSLFYVDKNEQENGEHEVHTANCTHSPGIAKCEPLGYHTACSTALNAAKAIYPKSNGCYYCSYSSYTSEDK